jgi:hypothetical protein
VLGHILIGQTLPNKLLTLVAYKETVRSVPLGFQILFHIHKGPSTTAALFGRSHACICIVLNVLNNYIPKLEARLCKILKLYAIEVFRHLCRKLINKPQGPGQTIYILVPRLTRSQAGIEINLF